MKRYRKMSNSVICTTLFAKFLFGVGLGLLIANYFSADWQYFGLVVIAASLLLHIPAAVQILKK